jgi:hypothetical protein
MRQSGAMRIDGASADFDDTGLLDIDPARSQ